MEGLQVRPITVTVRMYTPVHQTAYEQVSVSSGVGQTGCWHEYKSLRKRGINFISKPIDKLVAGVQGKCSILTLYVL